MLVKTHSAALAGIDAIIITIEVSIGRGAFFSMVGLPDAAVRESQDRVRTAIEQIGKEFPRKQVVVNLAPADVKKEGSAYDLPISVGILAASGQIQAPDLDKAFLMGELSLDGTILPLRGVLPMAIAARSAGFESMIVPGPTPTKLPSSTKSKYTPPTRSPTSSTIWKATARSNSSKSTLAANSPAPQPRPDPTSSTSKARRM